MTISGANLLLALGLALHDENEEIWTSDLKVHFINEALLAVASVRPDAVATSSLLTLIANTPRQSIPTGGYRLLNVLMNKTGVPIKKTTREDLNDTVPSWTVTESDVIENFAFDEENPTEFWVQPVPESALEILITYATEPVTFAAGASSIGISDIYIPAIKHFVLSKCYGMQTRGADYQKSLQCMTDFYKVLGLKFQSDTVLNAVQEE